jgi:hypothetical protein
LYAVLSALEGREVGVVGRRNTDQFNGEVFTFDALLARVHEPRIGAPDFEPLDENLVPNARKCKLWSFLCLQWQLVTGHKKSEI